MVVTVALAAVLVASVVSTGAAPAVAQELPPFTLDLDVRNPDVDEPVTVVVRFLDSIEDDEVLDASVTRDEIDDLLSAFPASEFEEAVRAGEAPPTDGAFPIVLTRDRPGVYEASVRFPEAGDWVLVPFPDSYADGSGPQQGAYPDPLRIGVGEEPARAGPLGAIVTLVLLLAVGALGMWRVTSVRGPRRSASPPSAPPPSTPGG